MKSEGEEILLRLREAVGVDTNSALSRHFGLGPNTLSKRVSEGGLPLKEAVQLAGETGLSLDWLVFGRAEPNVSYATSAPDVRGVADSASEPVIERDYATRLVLAIVDGVERALDTSDAELSIERKTKAVGALFRLFAIRGTLPTQAEIDSIIELMQ
tara:strand:+ start:471 stop:941 length:471 start_codon:yes stop_codon:yes gene_type:complete